MLTRHKKSWKHTDWKNRYIFNLNKTIFNLSTDYAKLNATITDHNLYLTTLLSKAHNENVKGQCFGYIVTPQYINLFCNLFLFWIFDIVGSIIWDMGGLGGLAPQKLWLLMKAKTNGTHLTPPPNSWWNIWPPLPQGIFIFNPPSTSPKKIPTHPEYNRPPPNLVINDSSLMCRENKKLWSRDKNDRQVNGRLTPQRILPVES